MSALVILENFIDPLSFFYFFLNGIYETKRYIRLSPTKSSPSFIDSHQIQDVAYLTGQRLEKHCTSGAKSAAKQGWTRGPGEAKDHA